MKTTALLFLSLLLCNITSAQFNEDNYTIKLSRVKFKHNYRCAKQLDGYLQESLTDNFNFGWKSTFQIKPVINTGKAHIIEGMDVKVAGKPLIEFHISDLSTKKEDIFIFEKELAGKNESQLGEELVNLFTQDNTSREELNQFITNFINSSFGDDCNEQFTQIDKLLKDNKFEKALRFVTNLLPSPCKDKAKLIQSELLEKQAQVMCETKIQQASVMVNSGVSFQMKRAIPILLSISPNAPCSMEAIELSKKIGTKMENTQQISTEMNQYQTSNLDQWRILYLQRLMTK